jgi:hypothetical protein
MLKTPASLLLAATLALRALAGLAAPSEKDHAAVGAGTPSGSAHGSGKTNASGKTRKKKAPHPSRTRPSSAGKTAIAPAPHRSKSQRLTAFPAEEAAVDQAFAENRREQVIGAERVARAEKQEDRWRTVLFHIREIDSHADPEACFWRAVAYYRLGEMMHAHDTRQACTLSGQASLVLDREEALATSLQPAAPAPELRLAGDRRPIAPDPRPIVNPDPYNGPSPAVLR